MTEVADDTPTACRFKNADAEWRLPQSDHDNRHDDALRRADALRADAPHRDDAPRLRIRGTVDALGNPHATPK